MDTVEILRNAICRNEVSSFRDTLARSPELKSRINEPLGPFNSPLILTVQSREMLDAMIEAGADVNARSSWWAGSFGLLDSADDELSRYAISRGARVDIHSASRLGMIDQVREFVSRDPKSVHRRGGDGQTPLHFARNIEIADVLIEHGAELNARDVDHESTPVQWMLDKRREVAGHLIERGAEGDIFAAAALGDLSLAWRRLKEDSGAVRMRVDSTWFPMSHPHAGGHIYQWTLGSQVSPHQVAARLNHVDVLDLLMEWSPDQIKLLNACWIGDRELMEQLLARDEQLTGKLSKDEQRQMAHAAKNNETRAVELMIDAGLPIDARGQHGGTALHWAAWHGNAEAVSLLLKAGAPTDLKDYDFNGTPLGWARHGRENSWHRSGGDYEGVIAALSGKVD